MGVRWEHFGAMGPRIFCGLDGWVGIFLQLKVVIVNEREKKRNMRTMVEKIFWSAQLSGT